MATVVVVIMDDFILTVLGNCGIKDFFIYLQIPHNPHSKDMAEGLAHGGLAAILEAGTSFRVNENLRGRGQGKRHFNIEVRGLTTKQRRFVNTFLVYVQMPATREAKAGVEAMVSHGLQYWLGNYCKNITVVKCEETNIHAWEPIGAEMKVS